MGQADRQDREDDDRDDLQVRNPRLEGVDTPGKDERLDGLPDGYDDVEAKDDREIPFERPSQFRQAADEAGRLVNPLGGTPDDGGERLDALQLKQRACGNACVFIQRHHAPPPFSRAVHIAGSPTPKPWTSTIDPGIAAGGRFEPALTAAGRGEDPGDPAPARPFRMGFRRNQGLNEGRRIRRIPLPAAAASDASMRAADRREDPPDPLPAAAASDASMRVAARMLKSWLNPCEAN